MKYVDASAVLRVVFREPGPAVELQPGDRVVASQLVVVETFRAIDRARFAGSLDDRLTAAKRKELTELLAMLDLWPIDQHVVDRASGSFAVPIRSLDAIHVATAELLAAAAEGAPLEFWTHNERQAIAAQSRGLNVYGGELRQS
jgi:predicted nucleic acid-binding protein